MIPWQEIIGVDEFCIVVAPVVVSELDKHKNNQNNKVSQRAKKVIKSLEKEIDGNESGLLILTKRPTENIFKKNNLLNTDADDCLLASVISFSSSTEKKTILITNDLGIKLKSKSLSIECTRISDEHRIAEELSEAEKEVDALRKELQQYKNRTPKLSLQFKNMGNRFVLRKRKIDFHRDEYVEFRMKKIKESITPIKIDEELISRNSNREQGLFIGLSSISESQMKLYNEDVEKYYFKYRAYLEKKYDYFYFLSSSFEVDLILSNNGTAPAENIDVYLHFPDGFKLSSKKKKRPLEPVEPYKPKSILDFGPPISYPYLPSINISSKSITSGPVLTQLKKTNSYDVKFDAGDLKHNQDVKLPKLFGHFETVHEMKSFSIDYTILVDNIPDKINGQLHVIVE